MIMATSLHAVGLSSPYAGGGGLAFISYRGEGREWISVPKIWSSLLHVILINIMEPIRWGKVWQG
jgi:hypothetical protein